MKDAIFEVLNSIPMPGENKSLTEAQIVSDVYVDDAGISISINLPQKNEKFQQALVPTIEDAIKRQLSYAKPIKVHVNIVKANNSNEPGGISKVKHIIAVASGKGGVGKSTVSVNTALALSKLGYSVGILDADIFGPSIPKMLATEAEKPLMKKEGEKELIIPIENYGIKMLSIGFFMQDSQALAWRGPMAGNVLKQLLLDADWGELDVMVIDMPPGTSDIQLTITQSIELSGAIMVSTPQDVALIDVIKGIDFFEKEKIEVPILGLIENMAWFTPAELPNNKYYIFGEGGAEKLAKERNIELLGQIPLIQGIREGGDSGKPVVLQENSLTAEYYISIAQSVAAKLGL